MAEPTEFQVVITDLQLSVAGRQGCKRLMNDFNSIVGRLCVGQFLDPANRLRRLYIRCRHEEESETVIRLLREAGFIVQTSV